MLCKQGYMQMLKTFRKKDTGLPGTFLPTAPVKSKKKSFVPAVKKVPLGSKSSFAHRICASQLN